MMHRVPVPADTELELPGTRSFVLMFGDKLLSPVSTQSACFAALPQFQQEYTEALLQKHLLCQAKLEGLSCVSLVFFFSTSTVLRSNFHWKNTAQRHRKWHPAL